VPSLDPTSLQSRCYQKALADLNAAYRDALTLAPTEIAVTLPATSFDPDRIPIGGDWEDLRSGTLKFGPEAAGGVRSNPGQGSRPMRLPPVIPSNPSYGNHASGHGNGSTVGERGSSGLTISSPSVGQSANSGNENFGGNFGSSHGNGDSGSPYGASSVLAASG